MRVKKAAGNIGAFVSQVSLAKLSDATKAELEQLLFEYGVLFFRDQKISSEAFRSLAMAFGDIESHPAYREVDTAPGVQILESTAEVPTKIEMWHSDMTFLPKPPAFTFLHAQILPDWGGDTLWASTTAAFDTLSLAVQNMLLQLEAVHDFGFGFQDSLAEPGGYARLKDAIAANPAQIHPLITTHPYTQKKAIFVNGLFTLKIRGVSALESRAILNMLYAHIVVPEHTVRLNWEVNTLVIWDNRITQHKPVNDYFPQRRLLHRVTVAGERPV